MTRQTLTEQIEAIAFSDTAREMFALLHGYSGADEGGAVILIAAAALLAREHPGTGIEAQNALRHLISEFGDLVIATHAELQGFDAGPRLRVVAGTNARRPEAASLILSTQE